MIVYYLFDCDVLVETIICATDEAEEKLWKNRDMTGFKRVKISGDTVSITYTNGGEDSDEIEVDAASGNLNF